MAEHVRVISVSDREEHEIERAQIGWVSAVHVSMMDIKLLTDRQTTLKATKMDSASTHSLTQ